MDYGQFQQNRPLASASLFTGIVSLLSCCICLVSIPLACLSILFAILSRRREVPMLNSAKAGIILSCMGIALSLILILLTIYLVASDPSLRQAFWESFQQSYQESLQQSL